MAGRATYVIADDRVRLEDLQINGNTVQLTGRALIDKPTTEQRLQADGMLQYDSEEFAKLLASYLGPEVQIYGDRQIRFEVAGKLAQDPVAPLHWSQRFEVTADAGWSSAAVYGLPIGAGQLRGTIAQGQLQVAPIDLPVGQGRLVASPRGVLAPEPSYLHLPKGVLFSSVEISPQVSEDDAQVRGANSGRSNADGRTVFGRLRRYSDFVGRSEDVAGFGAVVGASIERCAGPVDGRCGTIGEADRIVEQTRATAASIGQRS